jgi:hypothetical protein
MPNSSHPICRALSPITRTALPTTRFSCFPAPRTVFTLNNISTMLSLHNITSHHTLDSSRRKISICLPPVENDYTQGIWYPLWIWLGLHHTNRLFKGHEVEGAPSAYLVGTSEQVSHGGVEHSGTEHCEHRNPLHITHIYELHHQNGKWDYASLQ